MDNQYRDNEVIIKEMIFLYKINEGDNVSFDFMIENKIYKNLFCYDDQLYMKKNGQLYTSSFGSNDWVLSSASKRFTQFVPEFYTLRKRYKK